MKLLIITASLFLLTLNAVAESNLMIPYFKNELQKTSSNKNEAENLIFTPTQSINDILNNDSLDRAMSEASKLNLESFIKNSKDTATNLVSMNSDIGSKANLTLIIVPGVFGEFIKTRAFEDVLEKPSSFKTEFLEKVNQQSILSNADAFDEILYLKQYEGAKSQPTLVTLDQVFHVGEVKIENKNVKVALLATPFASLESLGDAKIQAARFNRRLSKLIKVMGLENDNLAFVGYSRGTVLGLEMLAQAKAENKTWLKNVKGMISLSGVVWGSSLADDAVENEKSPNYQNLLKVNELSNNLQEIPDDASFLTKGKIIAANTKQFFSLASLIKNNGTSPSVAIKQVESMANIDLRSPFFILQQMWKELGLSQFFSGYSGNIVRFKYLVSQITASVRELSSQARLDWWSTHQIPTDGIIYYSISAVMADPEKGPIETELFKNPLAYGQGSYDDEMLLTNHRDYNKASGVELNDSQVSVVQASFLPYVIANLNTSNAGIKTKNLGTLGTHHWGLALREVNKMKGKQVNGFPREILLKSIAYQILIDN